MHRYDNEEDFDAERDKDDRLAIARNTERDRDDRIMDPPRPQGDERQNMNAPAGGRDGDGDGGGDGNNIFGNTYGLNIRFLKSLGINEPLVNRVFVANLDYTVDEDKLLEVFKLAGKVLNVELSRDKQGNSRGFAMVEYDHPVESVQAISMLHNQELYDRRMIVRLDRGNELRMSQNLPEGLKGIGMGLGIGGKRLMDVARNIPNIQANNPPVVNPISAAVSAVGDFGAGLNNAVPAQLGVGASGQGNNAFDGSNFARDRDFGDKFNRGDNDFVPSGGGGFAGNQGLEEGGNSQNTCGARPTSDSILIRNLPPNTTWQMLRDEFQDVGEVKFAEIRRTGMGIVKFGSDWDAVRAVCMMNRARIKDRTIDVCLY